MAVILAIMPPKSVASVRDVNVRGASLQRRERSRSKFAKAYEHYKRVRIKNTQFQSLSMPGRSDRELAQLVRQKLRSARTDWEVLEPFLNRVLKPCENEQVLLHTLCL